MIVEKVGPLLNSTVSEGVDTNGDDGLSTGVKNLRNTAATCVGWGLTLRCSTVPSANQMLAGRILCVLSPYK